MSELEKSIIKTVVYFDIFDYPLTSWEIYTFLYSDMHYSFLDIQLTLDKGIHKLTTKNGFYFLEGREECVHKRLLKNVKNTYKIEKARRAVGLWSFIPYVRYIAICNNLSFFNAKEDSDLDFFVIAKKGYLPFVRFLMVVSAILFFKRPTVAHSKDSLCLSFLIDETMIDLTSLQKKDDIYFKYWFVTLLSLYDYNRLYSEKLVHANSSITNFFSHYGYAYSHTLQIFPLSLVKNFFEIILRPIIFFVPRLYHFQRKRLPPVILQMMNTSTSVMIKPSIFKTHVHDQRNHIFETWRKRVEEYTG